MHFTAFYNFLGECPIYEIVSKGDLTHVFFFKISNCFIFEKSEMSSTHCFLRTENRSIRHGVVRSN